MAIDIFESGTTISINCLIKTIKGVPYNPTTLTFSMLMPMNLTPTVITYSYPEDSGLEIIKQQVDDNSDPIVGAYYIEWPTTVAGQYQFLWAASGDLSVTKRGAFTVQKWGS